MRSFKQKQRRQPKGQAIVEYATVIAFVCCLIALAFQIAHGTLFAGISGAYSITNSSLDKMNQAALSAGN
jgi:hypothetical protein